MVKKRHPAARYRVSKRVAGIVLSVSAAARITSQTPPWRSGARWGTLYRLYCTPFTLEKQGTRVPGGLQNFAMADPVPSMFLHYYMYYIEGAFARISPGTGHRDKKSRDAVHRHRGCKATGTGAALLQPPRLVFGRRSVLLHLSGFPLVSTVGVWSLRNLPPQIPSLSYAKYITFRRWCKGIPRRLSSRRRIWC